MKANLLSTMGASLLIFSCSSTPKVPTNESFVADITELGHKRFVYKASLGAAPHNDGSHGSKHNRGPGMGGKGKPARGKPSSGIPGHSQSNSGDIKKMAMARVELLINENGFCSNGWFPIEQTFEKGRAEIHGECRAVAAQSDR
ncbi:hypothetical protein MJO52_17880 [Microbulbifer variabilis]|uniref:Lipoprotein n=1 Tax=Microbulbifer variabilis TaxID=266805 RepID=A0ABY4VDF9_9GAMM|nr:hypothetical protein [Microbulbifer variabilis]USD20910.1 hypothetical protein MJO52_17880 [Microbulbifer variabilis]